MSYIPEFLPKLDKLIDVLKTCYQNPNVPADNINVVPTATDYPRVNIYIDENDFNILEQYLPQYLKQNSPKYFGDSIDWSKSINSSGKLPVTTGSQESASASAMNSKENSTEMSLYKSDSAKQAGLMSNPSNQGDNQ